MDDIQDTKNEHCAWGFLSSGLLVCWFSQNTYNQGNVVQFLPGTTVLSFLGYNSQGMKMTTHLCLVCKLRKTAAIPPLLHTPSECVNRQLYLTLHHTRKFLIIIAQTLPTQKSEIITRIIFPVCNMYFVRYINDINMKVRCYIKPLKLCNMTTLPKLCTLHSTTITSHLRSNQPLACWHFKQK